MPSPDIELQLEPMQLGSVTYLELVSSPDISQSLAQICLQAAIKNNEPSPIILKRVIISFPESTVPSADISCFVSINPGSIGKWFLINAGAIMQYIRVTLPVPPFISAEFYFSDYDEPYTRVYPLTKHLNPSTGNAYRFPARASDLEKNEYWVAKPRFHASGNGTQAYAYDMHVEKWIPESRTWTGVNPDIDPGENNHSLTWDKPIVAMSDGVVMDVRTYEEDNYPRGAGRRWTGPDGGGNCLFIQHGDEVVLYAHLKKGSINRSRIFVGAMVREGDVIGRAGNSGSSTSAHLHLHASKLEDGVRPSLGTLRPIHFRDIQSADRRLFLNPPRVSFWTPINFGSPDINDVVWPEPAFSPLDTISLRRWLFDLQAGKWLIDPCTGQPIPLPLPDDSLNFNILFATEGVITDAEIDENLNLQALYISEGSLEILNLQNDQLKLTIPFKIYPKTGSFSGLAGFNAITGQGFEVMGLILEENVVKAVIMKAPLSEQPDESFCSFHELDYKDEPGNLTGYKDEPVKETDNLLDLKK